MRRTSVRLAILIVAASVTSFAASSSPVPGVGNFQKVDDHVYRGAQPTEQGFQNLAKLGIKTVLDLQEVGDARSVNEEKWVKAAGMKYLTIPMKGMETPSDDAVGKALAYLEDSSAAPIFVHCHRGADRTGGVIAVYRIEHDKWQNDKALKEARKLGMSWYQIAIQNYVRGYRPKAGAAVTTPELAGMAAASSNPAAGIAAAASATPVPQTPPPAPKLP